MTTYPAWLMQNFHNYWKLPSNLLQIQKEKEGTLLWLAENQPLPLEFEEQLPLLHEIGFVDARFKSTSKGIQLSFDLLEVMESFYLEKYPVKQLPVNRLSEIGRRLYYLARPLIPRSIQIKFRQKLAKVQGKSTFPAWPIDNRFDSLMQKLLAQAMSVSGIGKIPILGWWPDQKQFTIALRHDVETAVGVQNIKPLVALEKKYGFRSTWYFVPERYPFDKALLRELQDDGCEIGVHGLYHDGKLFDSHQEFQQRAAKINRYLDEWQTVGFASPSALRRLDWICEELDIIYDSSVPTSEVFGPQSGGCCSLFPFFIGNNIIELPITMPQDHTLFEILQETSIKTWLGCLNFIRENHGLLFVIVHPDYVLTPERLHWYEEFLEHLADEQQGWMTMPSEIAQWWKTRHDSEVTIKDGKPVIIGPAYDRGQVEWANLEDKTIYFTKE